MKYERIIRGMVLKVKPSRATDYGLICNTVTVLGRKDRNGYKVGQIFAAYLVRDSYGTREVSGYFKPSDFQHCVEINHLGTVGHCCRNCGNETGNVGEVKPGLCNLCAIASGV